MGALVDNFAGKISGELIKASDWNGLVQGIENLVLQLEASLDARLDPLEAAIAGLQNRTTALENRLTGLEALAETLRQRFRHVTLRAATTTFAIGQRGVITAAVTQLDGTPLNLADAATRPWVDFVTVWGTLKAAAGFNTRGGANDKTVSVQVNASGEAQVLLRAEHAEAFAEEEELEIEAVLATRVPAAGGNMPVSQAFLSADTPASVGASPAYGAVTQAYHRTDTTIMQRYLDTYYVLNPSRAVGAFTSGFQQRWRDYRATVMVFVKPDADPTSPDGAQATASIQVSFRDWIGPWIIIDYLPKLSERITDYRDRFRARIGTNFGVSLDSILNEVDLGTRSLGVLGKQRELAAAREAITGLNITNPPPFLSDLVSAVEGGIGVQQSLGYNEAITPVSSRPNQVAKVLATSSSRAVSEANRVEQVLADRVSNDLNAATKSLLTQVRVEQTAFREELLRDDGVIVGVESQLRDVRAKIEGVSQALGRKADLDFVTRIVRG